MPLWKNLELWLINAIKGVVLMIFDVWFKKIKLFFFQSKKISRNTNFKSNFETKYFRFKNCVWERVISKM